MPFYITSLVVCPGFLLRTGPQFCVMLGTMSSNRTNISEFQDQENQEVLRHRELLKSGTGMSGGGHRNENAIIRHSSAHLHLEPS